VAIQSPRRRVRAALARSTRAHAVPKLETRPDHQQSRSPATGPLPHRVPSAALGDGKKKEQAHHQPPSLNIPTPKSGRPTLHQISHSGPQRRFFPPPPPPPFPADPTPSPAQRIAATATAPFTCRE